MSHNKVNTAVFEEFPVMETRRLTLRTILPSDAESIFAMRSDTAVNRFIARDSMFSSDSAVTLVEKTSEAFNSKRGIGWAGVLRDQKSIIGTCGFNSIDYPNLRAEIGGEMAANYWGKYLAIEATSAIVQFGFDQMQLHSIEAKVNPNNRGAIHLLKQLGFKQEALFKDRIYFNNAYQDMAVYTVFKSSFTPH